MTKPTYQFPPGFLWGAATASHQVEGNNTNNNWYAWEQQPGRIINGNKSGLAADWWGGRWKEDLDRAAETGQNAHRLSIEWSRIQPAPDRWDEGALDYYRQMLRGMLDRKLTPMVTLHHFSDPLWIYEQGGWENDDTPKKFAVFVRKVVEAMREYCTLWVTINEPNVYTYSGYLSDDFPPGKNDGNAAFKVMANLLRGHAAAYRIIHELQKEAQVGFALHYRGFWPEKTWFPLDGMMANILHENFNASFVNAIARGRFNFMMKSISVPEAVGTQDYIGLNYYTCELVRFDLTATSDFFNRRRYEPGVPMSPTGFISLQPKGIYNALKWLRGFGLPLYVTENGVEDPDDTFRPRYTLEHLHQIWKALNMSWPVKGYFHWSLVDNFEWERGWTQRFGLWGLNTETQGRVRRSSVDMYATICKENAISYETVEKYAPASLKTIFP